MGISLLSPLYPEYPGRYILAAISPALITSINPADTKHKPQLWL